MESSRDESSSIRILGGLEKIIFNMNDENVEFSVQQTMNLFDGNFPYSFNVAICMLVYTAFASQREDANKYLFYLKSLQSKEEKANVDNTKIVEIFAQYLSRNETQESYFLLEKMIEQNLIESSITKNIRTKYFAHYKTIEEGKKWIYDPFYDEFLENIDELSKNDWELHRRFVQEGVNPSDIAKVIRSDSKRNFKKYHPKITLVSTN